MKRDHTHSGPVVTLGAPGADPLVGVVIDDRYRLVSRIGDGGMGVVFRAEHIRSQHPVAIKLLHAQLTRIPAVVQRFEREVKSVGRLAHDHIVQVIDYGRTAAGALYLVMELVEGESLASVIHREGRLPQARAIVLVSQVLAALEHAHGHRVIHRDLKPENIILQGGRDDVKLVDFGIAKLRDDNLPSLTAAGVACGTPEYMAPEQASSGEVDGRADLYSVGVILFEMLTGKKPFVAAGKPVDVMIMQRMMQPPVPRKLAPDADISDATEAVILRALAKSRDSRFATAAEFLAALEGRPLPAKRPAPRSFSLRAKLWWYSRPPRIKRALQIGALAVGVLAGLAMAYLIFGHKSAAPVVEAADDALVMRYINQYEESKPCAERRQALLKLRDLGDPRGLEVLRRAQSKKGYPRVRACMSRQELDDAVRDLESIAPR